MLSEIEYLHKKMTFDDEIVIWTVNNDLEFIIRKNDIIKETGSINDLIKVLKAKPSGEIVIIDTDAIIAIKLREKVVY